MAKGGYNGGSTLIGFGRGGMFDPQFDIYEKPRPGEPNNSVKRRRRVKSTQSLTVAGKKLSEKTLNNHRLAKRRKIDRNEVLIGISRPMPKKHRYWPEALKQLVADNILLPTGAINVDHPAVAAWLSSNGKKSK